MTLHWPESPGDLCTLRRNGKATVPHAYQLDDAPGFERFFFLTSSGPFDLEDVMSAARALGSRPGSARVEPLPLPADIRQSSLLLEKSQP